MTVDHLALTFELEVKAANAKCQNCGRVGLSTFGQTIVTSVSPRIDFAQECQCNKCEALQLARFSFAKEEAKFIV